MKSYLKKYRHLLRHIHLSPQEKGDLRATLVARMAASKIPDRAETRLSWAGVFSARYLRIGLASCIILTLAGSATVSAAQRALPGEVLYPVKIKVTEPVARLLKARTPLTAARFEIGLVEKRLAEIEELAGAAPLSENQKRELDVVVAHQAVKAANAIEHLEITQGVLVEFDGELVDEQIIPEPLPEPVEKTPPPQSDNKARIDPPRPAVEQPSSEPKKDESRQEQQAESKDTEKLRKNNTRTPDSPPSQDNAQVERSPAQERAESRAPAVTEELEKVFKKHEKTIRELRDATDRDTREKKEKDRERAEKEEKPQNGGRRKGGD